MMQIADFGLARALDIKSRIQTKTCGTLTHQPPETLMEGIISKAVDVYSFGVLLWQVRSLRTKHCTLRLLFCDWVN